MKNYMASGSVKNATNKLAHSAKVFLVPYAIGAVIGLGATFVGLVIGEHKDESASGDSVEVD